MPHMWLSPMAKEIERQNLRRRLADEEAVALEKAAATAVVAPSYFIGLDLGQAQDYSALCIVERTNRPDPQAPEGEKPRDVNCYGVRHLHRWKLGTPYSIIVEEVVTLCARPPLPGASLVLDATGVGRPVVEMFRAAKLPVKLIP